MEEEGEPAGAAPGGGGAGGDGAPTAQERLRGEAPAEVIRGRGRGLAVLAPGSAVFRCGWATATAPLEVPHCAAVGVEVTSGAETCVSPHCIPPEFRVEEAERARAVQAAVDRARLRGGVKKRGLGAVGASVTPVAGATEGREEGGGFFFERGPGAAGPWTGWEALRLRSDPASPAQLQFPMRRGRLNTLIFSQQHVRDLVALIWRAALEDSRVGLDAHARADAAALLVVPDSLDVDEISLLADVVLQDLGFRACAVHVESVAAAFSHGAPVSCVVNLGAQASSVVCVEDGCALPASRIFLPFGGDDLSQTLWWLLLQGGAGTALDGLGACQGAAVLDACKEAVLRVPVDDAHLGRLVREAAAADAEPFAMRVWPEDSQGMGGRLGSEARNLELRLGMVPTIVPIGLFEPALMGVCVEGQIPGGVRLAEGAAAGASAAEGAFEQEMGVLRAVSATKIAVIAGSGVGPFATAAKADQLTRESAELGCVGPLVSELLKKAHSGAVEPEHFGLDLAVVHSIDRAYRPDLRGRLFANILVVGGTGQLAGLPEALESRVEQLVRGDSSAETVNVKPPKAFPGANGVPQSRATAVWRGACLLAALDLNRDESWLSREEWVHGGCVNGAERRRLGERDPLVAQLLWHVAN